MDGCWSWVLLDGEDLKQAEMTETSPEFLPHIYLTATWHLSSFNVLLTETLHIFEAPLIWILFSFQMHEECAHVGITADMSLMALDASEKLGVDLANLLLSKGAKDILTMARQLNDVR